jgi:hypothetical protein
MICGADVRSALKLRTIGDDADAVHVAEDTLFRTRLEGFAAAAHRIVPLVLYLVAPLALAATFLGMVARDGRLGGDFRYVFWQAGRDVLHGRTPYPPLDASVLAERASYVYPPIVAIALAPFSLLPAGVAAVFMVLLTALSIAATLWVLDVRDWRCYGVLLASPVVLTCLETAALSGFLALAIALAWRTRARGPASPILIAVAITTKLFLWPLLLWLFVVRGLRCAIATGSAALLLVLAPWLLGFPGLRSYPTLLWMMTEAEGAHAYTPRTLAHSLGASWGAAEIIAIALGGTLIALAIYWSRHPDADRRTLGLTVLASLLLSPLVWAHYLLVLLPVMATASKRLSAVWFCPLGLWFAGGTWGTPSSLQIVVSLAVMLLATLPALRGTKPLVAGC